VALSERTIAAGVRNRILILDVERVMPEYRIRSWSRKFDRYLNYEQLVTDARTSLVCWSWYDEDEIHSAAEWDKGGRNAFLRRVHGVMEQADIIVTHNGANADEPWLLADFTIPRKGAPQAATFKRLPELPPWKTVDTLKTLRSKRYKGIDFKGLDAVCQIVGLPGKTDSYDYRTMDAAVAGDRDAQQILTAYCKGDVAAERFVYDWLRPGMANHPHLFVEGEGALVVCNRCASSETLKTAKRYMANVQSYEMLRCATCTGYRRISWEPERFAAVRGV
jgi:hypothetical protein